MMVITIVMTLSHFKGFLIIIKTITKNLEPTVTMTTD
jgi:hypothetical protein